MGKQYAGMRKLQDIKRDVLKAGLSWNQLKYDAGSDWVHFGNEGAHITYNTFNGTFITEVNGNYVTERSDYMDGIKWYDDLLDFLYVTYEAKK